MPTAATLTSKGQTTIPKEIREKFNLKPGQKLAFIPYKGTLRVVVVQPAEAARGMLRGLNTEALREEDDEARP